MGTHRSKHNKGRKPIYKDHGRATAGPVETDRWADEAEQFQQDKRLSILLEARMSGSRGDWRIPKPNPDLLPAVKRYLEARRPACAAPEVKRSAEEFVLVRSEQGHIVASNRDLLLQLYIERKIDRVQLSAGRAWQHYMEAASIQPGTSLDPSSPINRQTWQMDGDLTETQYRAVTSRRIASTALGARAFRFLEIVLQPDIGRSEAIRTTRMTAGALTHALGWLLQGLAIYLGYRTSDDDAYGAFREAAVKRADYQAQASAP